MSKDKKTKAKYSFDELKEKYIDRKTKPITILARDEVTGLNIVISFIVNLFVLLAIGLIGGYYLDRWLGTTPFFMIILVIIGIIAAFRNLISWYYKQEVKEHGVQQSKRNNRDGNDE